MADSVTGTKTKTGFDSWVVSYKTVKDVLFSLDELAKGRKIKDKKQLADLQKAVNVLLANKGYGGSGAVEKEAVELLNFLANLDPDSLIEERDEDEKMESRIPDNLDELVAEYEEALRKKDSEREKILAREIEKETGLGVGEYIERQREIARERQELEQSIEREKEEERTKETKLRNEVPEVEVTAKTGKVREDLVRKTEEVTEKVAEVGSDKEIQRPQDEKLIEKVQASKTKEKERSDRDGNVDEVKIESDPPTSQPVQDSGEARTHLRQDSGEARKKEDKTASRQIEVEEILLTAGLEEKVAEKIVKKTVKAELVNIEKLNQEVKRAVVLAGVEKGKSEDMAGAVIEEVAKTSIERESRMIVEDLERELVKQGLEIDGEVLTDKVMDCWRKNESLEMGGVKELAKREGGGEISENEKIGLEIAIRKADQQIMGVMEGKGKIVETERLRVIREEIVSSVKKAGDVGSKEMEVVKEYTNLVTDIYKDNPASKHRTRVIMRSSQGAGAIEKGFGQVEVVTALIGKGGVRKKIEQFSRYRRLIENFGVSNNVSASRSVNEVFSFLQRSPEVVSQIENVRNRIAWAQNWGEKITGVFKPGGIDNLFLDLSKKVVDQPLFQFVNETSALMAGGKSFGEALGVTLKSLISNGKVVAGTAVKEGVGAAAGTAATGAAASGTSGVLATIMSGPLAPIVAAVVAVVTAAAPIVKKIKNIVSGLMKQMGLDLGIKKWASENFGKAGNWMMGAMVGLGGIVLGAGGILTASLSGIGSFVTMIVAGPIIFIFVLILFFAGPMVSSLVPPANLGTGSGAAYDAAAPALVAGRISQCANGMTSASVRSRVDTRMKQDEGVWKDEPLPQGCTYSDSGCGPTSVSKILVKEDSIFKPNYLVQEPGSAYASMGCQGSTLDQAVTTLRRHTGNRVTYDGTTRRCTKQDIANWICEGKIVMVLANFYINSNLDLGGHYFLAVEYRNGEIYSADPFFDDGPVMNGDVEYGKVQAIRDCITID